MSQSSEVSYQIVQIGSQSSEISAQSSQLSNQSAQISSLETKAVGQSQQIALDAEQLAADNSEIANLTSKVGSLNSQISSLQFGVNFDIAKIVTLENEFEGANLTIVSLDSEVANLTSRVGSLNAQVAMLNAQVAADNSRVSALQAQVANLTSITGLSQSQVEGNGTVQFGQGSVIEVAVINAHYAGYVILAITAATDYAHDGAQIQIEFASNVHSPTFSGITIPGDGLFYAFTQVPEYFVFPVTPGTIIVALATSDPTENVTYRVLYYS
jgi:polyhydroxyalkanoate synthesis regulator phasin